MRVLALLLVLATPATAGEVITGAEYEEPTTRYAHGVLGDAVEWGRLTITTSESRRLVNVLPEERVFEDLEPRLADLDNDGRPEVIVVESHRNFGARLAIYGIDGLITATDWIGTTNRWLAPIGAADIDGNGTMDIAYVDRPHLAKVIRIFSYVDGELVGVVGLPGYSNHRIGEDYISGGIRSCGDGPEMVVAKGDWSAVVSIRWTGNGFAETELSRDTSPSGFSRALTC